MPEGDILRRAARTLEQALTGQVLTTAELRWPGAGSVNLVGRTVMGTVPYGKHLFTRFDDGRSLHTHLRMEGSWRLVPSPAAATGPFVRVVLGTPEWTAVGHRIGMLDVVPTRDEHTLIGHLGPDVLAEDFPRTGLPVALERLAAHGTRPICEGLLDQQVLAGIGTIFMAESLHARRLWPWTPAQDLADPASLLMTARELMQRSVAAQQPTATGEAGPGRATRVHGRMHRPCRRCGTPIAVGQAGRPPRERPVFYCPECQRPGGPT